MKHFILKSLGKILRRIIKHEHYRNLEKLINEGALVVGKHTYGVVNLTIDAYKGSEAKVIIGKYCSIGPDVRIITGGNHPINRISTFPFRIQWDMKNKYEDGFPYSNGDVTIGHDVWICTSVTILSGVSVGHGAVLAAGSLVTKNIPPYAIAAGNPAKIIKFRFGELKIKELLDSRWWEWDEKEIKEKIVEGNGDLYANCNSNIQI